MPKRWDELNSVFFPPKDNFFMAVDQQSSAHTNGRILLLLLLLFFVVVVVFVFVFVFVVVVVLVVFVFVVVVVVNPCHQSMRFV